MKKNTGLLCAIITIFIWGTTYVFTKLLLRSFSPVEILFIRFMLGYATLWVLCPKKLRLGSKKHELYFVFAGLSGITLYYLLENIALVYTTASNVGIIISVAPFFTSILSWLVLKEEKPGLFFFAGFVLAMIGIAMISLQNTFSFHPKGDLLALLAAVVWAIYSILTKKINTLGHSVLLLTRRTFFYGLLFIIPFFIGMGGSLHLLDRLTGAIVINYLFLGIGACALCFVAWNIAVKSLGVVKTSVFIYLVPIITTISAVIVLHETITKIQIIGIVLTLFGLVVSGIKKKQTIK